MDQLVIRGAREHNLRNISLELPRDRLIVFTGLSGSGKSSLAFDTIYAEGQRRYVESLSSYARQFLGQMDKPDVDFIEGLSPAISIDQKSASRNPRSTVGTITEVYDYLRLLFARIGIPHCPNDGTVITRQTPQQIVDRVLELPEGTRFQVLAPVVRGRKGTYDTLLADLAGQGFARAIVDGELHELTDTVELARYEQHTIEVVVDRLVRREGIERRLTDSLETALRIAEGVAEVQIMGRHDDTDVDDEVLTFSQHLGCPKCGLSSRSWRRATSRSTRPTARASTATDSAPGSRSIPSWSCPTPTSASPRARLRRGPPPEPSTSTGCSSPSAPNHGTSVPTYRGRTSRRSSRRCCSTASAPPAGCRSATRTATAASARTTTKYEGVIPWLQRRHSDAESDNVREQIEGYMREVPCPECGGARLDRLSLGVTIDGNSLHDLSDMSIADAAETLAGLELSERDRIIAERVVKEVNARMGFLLDVGLDYLSSAVGRHPRRWRGPAHPPRVPDRLGTGGGALRARRTVHRLAPARQPSPHRHPLPTARPRQHGPRRRARRGDDHGRPTPSSTSARGPASTAARSSTPARSTGILGEPRSITGQYLSGARSFRSRRCAAARCRRARRSAARTSTTSRTSTSTSRWGASSRSPA